MSTERFTRHCGRVQARCYLLSCVLDTSCEPTLAQCLFCVRTGIHFNKRKVSENTGRMLSSVRVDAYTYIADYNYRYKI